MLRYLFVDMNSFFASVEQQERPELRRRPVAVIPVMAQTTCCIAASYEAKALGVKTGTPVRQGNQLCPDLQWVLARPRLYVQYHHRIVEAVESCLHVDRVCSVDEMYGRLMGQECRPPCAAALAQRVKDAIHRQVGQYMHSSIGLGPSAWLAKVASDMHKPDGLTMIQSRQMPEAIHSLALTDLPGIASNMLRRLQGHGIYHVHQLGRLGVEELTAIWSSRILGETWWHRLRGHDTPERPTRRSAVSHSHVLAPKLRNSPSAHAVLVRLIHKAAARLRRIQHWAGRLTLSVRFLGGPTWQARQPLGSCRDTLTILHAFETAWSTRPAGTPYHVGIVLTDLTPDRNASLPLYPEQVRRNALADLMDRLNHKYGRKTLYFGGLVGAEGSAPTRISFTQIPSTEEWMSDQ